MRLLLIHADYLEFEAKERTPVAEEVPVEHRSGRADEVLVAFAAVEREDEANPERVADKASREILEVFEKVKAERVVLYPYAHLSQDLAAPDVATQVLEGIRERLGSQGVEVLRLPFGWYKAFKLSCKGHPLSELSRTVTAEEEAMEAEVEKVPSKYIVLSPDGSEHELDLGNMDACGGLDGQPSLKQFVLSEELGRKPGKEPPHIKLMRRLEIADYEPASDTGHLRFYPKGAFIRKLLEDLADQLALEIGATTIETPVLYRGDEPDITEQARKFYQKDYKIHMPNRTLILRFAGDFGLFRMMKDATMSYRQLPVRVYELSPSYRLEQSGECVGLKRLRAFTMPDVHCFCKDMEQGMEEYQQLFSIYARVMDAARIDYVVAFRVVEEFYRDNKEFIIDLLRKIGKPALVELLSKQKHYWVMKHEFQVVDAVGGSAQLSTVQLDLEDSERYGIFYVDESGEKKGCIILHSSMGSIERWIYAVLEEAAKRAEAGGVPALPLWLAPTQVRLVPVSERYLDLCHKIADELEEKKIRVDIDDRDMTVPKKIREAEREWISYVIVIGEKEAKGEKLTVRIREDKELREMTVEELAKQIREKTDGMPFRPLPLPRLLSARPIFVGG
ncbi:MAG: threonine--tRNA ligase [Hadesarchaea archaeon]|nr:threonine--tRNA ligase [Hadesarchaea archaeon]